jgi:hypothetical protein
MNLVLNPSVASTTSRPSFTGAFDPTPHGAGIQRRVQLAQPSDQQPECQPFPQEGKVRQAGVLKCSLDKEVFGETLHGGRDGGGRAFTKVDQSSCSDSSRI